MKAVELKCGAVLTLVLLGREPNSYISGLRKMEKMANHVSLSGQFSATHPEGREREQFTRSFPNRRVRTCQSGTE